MSPRQLRPLAIGEIVDAALRLVQENLRAFVLTALVFVLPSQLAEHAVSSGSGLNDVKLVRDFGGHVHLAGMSWTAFGFALACVAVIAVLQAVFTLAACTYAAALAYVDSERPRPREALGSTLRRSRSLLPPHTP